MTVGMLDFTAENGVKDPEGTVVAYGSGVFSDGHGAAVEGLIAGSTDGSGIMGVMPSGSAKVVVYDPYDDTDTTNWTDIGDGYATLMALKINLGNGLLVSGAHVVNASLGVPGWTLNPGWNTVFANNPTLAMGAAHNTILVVAAGNDGTSQTTNVPWNFAINPQLLIVGSVGLNGQISNFSNTPGTACLSDTAGPAGACTQTLASRFIVAPGELILISDNNGNISRQTGTSLAAPLVTGAIGLLQARWPWLVNLSRGDGRHHPGFRNQTRHQSGQRPDLWCGRAQHPGVAIAAQLEQSRILSRQVRHSFAPAGEGRDRDQYGQWRKSVDVECAKASISLRSKRSAIRSATSRSRCRRSSSARAR